MLDYDMKQFIKYYGKGHICSDYANYSSEVIGLLETVYKIADRFLLRRPQILFILDNTLNYLRSHNVFNYKEIENNIESEIIKMKELEIKKLKEEIKELEKTVNKSTTIDKMTIIGIADYLGVSRQSIYNLKKKGENKCQKKN